MATDRLAIWIYGVKAAIVDEERRRLRLQYTTEATERFPAGSPLLSLRLPLTTERFGNGIARPFLDGLLPEGEPRRAIAEDLELRADDTFGLIRALGRDCAGAIVVQPEDEPPPPDATTVTADPLEEDELARLVDNLRTVPLGLDPRVRISLAGVQEKLLLTRLPDRRWGRPVDGTPSTHILKPEIRGYPNTVKNEAFCMRLARHLGVPVAEVETIEVQGRPLIVVTRYDRIVEPSGAVRRVHQEDFCQVTGNPPRSKYQQDGGPSFAQIANTLREVDPTSLETLLKAMTLQVLTGNGDAHGKNYSLLHEESGALRLAPIYDVMSTLYYKDMRLAMYIDSVQRLDRVTADRIINEATAWGMSSDAATEVVTSLLDDARTAIATAVAETVPPPAEISDVVEEQLKRLTTKKSD
jgi:serine/threonine-protein kinase HipA